MSVAGKPAMTKHDHVIHTIVAPTGYTLRCSCGWCRQIPRQNAFVRAVKVKAAIREHEAQIAAQEERGPTPS